jgi:hypothetical protein
MHKVGIKACIIMHTGNNLSTDVAIYKRAGAHGVVGKGENLKDMIAMIYRSFLDCQQEALAQISNTPETYCSRDSGVCINADETSSQYFKVMKVERRAAPIIKHGIGEESATPSKSCITLPPQLPHCSKVVKAYDMRACRKRQMLSLSALEMPSRSRLKK